MKPEMQTGRDAQDLEGKGKKFEPNIAGKGDPLYSQSV